MSALIDLAGHRVHNFRSWFHEYPYDQRAVFYVGNVQLKAEADAYMETLTLLEPDPEDSAYDISWKLRRGEFVYLPHIWPKPFAWFCKPLGGSTTKRIGRWRTKRERDPEAVARRTRSQTLKARPRSSR
jgi:hypothetical protein